MNEMVLGGGDRFLQILLRVSITALMYREDAERFICRHKTGLDSEGLLEVAFGIGLATDVQQQISEVIIRFAFGERRALHRCVAGSLWIVDAAKALRWIIAAADVGIEFLLDYIQVRAKSSFQRFRGSLALAYSIEETPELILPVAISEHQVMDQCP